jgi:peroxiredoxin Q/BCP
MKPTLALAALLFLPAAASAELNVGDKAPEFTATDDRGEEWKSSDHVGEKVLVVYFYPADMTGGCTKQACSFRDDMGDLEKLGVEVVGVSGDSPENHRIFKKAHDLNFTLLADEKGELAKAFGVPTKPGGTFNTKVDGEDVALVTGVRAARWTFVIGPDGKVVYKNTKVNPEKDAAAVKEIVEKLKAGQPLESN